jgi:hypothetical protein
MNACGFDMIYLDNSNRVQSPIWYYKTKVQMAIYNWLNRQNVLVQGSGYTAYTWHAFARYTSGDTYRSFPHYWKENLKRKVSKEHLDRMRIKRIISYKRNLMPAELGWFGLFKDTTPDEIEYLCGKAAGYDVPISIETRAYNLDSNPRTLEMLSIIKNYEALRLENYFSEKEKAKLREPGREYRLIQGSEGKWAFVPTEYEPERLVSVVDGKDNVSTVINNGSNPQQPIELEVKIGESKASRQLQEVQNPAITVGKQTLTFPTALNQNDLLVFKSMEDCKVYRNDGSAENLTPIGNPPTLKVGENQVIFSWAQTERKYQVGVRIIKVY